MHKTSEVVKCVIETLEHTSDEDSGLVVSYGDDRLKFSFPVNADQEGERANERKRERESTNYRSNGSYIIQTRS